jgi:hypothetical protein
MKIEIKNRGSMYVYDDDKYIRLTGELSAGPDYIFYIDLHSLDCWTVGMGKFKISEKEKEEIKKKIIEEGEKMKLKIIFD